MEDFGTDSRMQARECSGLHDRGKGVKTAERPIKAHSNGTLRHFHVLSGLSLVAQAAMRLVPRLGKPCKTACKNQKKNPNTLKKMRGFEFTKISNRVFGDGFLLRHVE